MGGAVCCAKEMPAPPESPAGGFSSVRNSIRLAICGDYFDRDTRALMAICDMAEVSFEFKVIDTFNGGNLEASYRELCPSSTIPLLKQGSQIISGSDIKQFYQHLVQNF